MPPVISNGCTQTVCRLTVGKRARAEANKRRGYEEPRSGVSSGSMAVMALEAR